LNVAPASAGDWSYVVADLIRAQRLERLPVVLTVDEVRRVLGEMDGACRLVAELLYGSGLRLLEALMLRVKDVDFERGQLAVRDPKWKHDRVTMLPRAVTASLHEQLTEARLLHEEDLAAGFGSVWLPDALPESCRPPFGTGVGSGCFPRPLEERRRRGRQASPARVGRTAGRASGSRPGLDARSV
jgi:integrase